MASTLIDVHPHMISADTKRYPMAPVGGKRSDWSEARPHPFEDLLAGMDEAGVDKACIVHSSTTYGYDASYVADTVEAHPKRFTGTFSIDMLAPEAPEKVRYWVGRGLTGLRVFTGGSTFEKQSDILSDPRTFPAWEAAGELGITVITQLRPEGQPQLLTLIERFPTTRILVDNVLYPKYEDGPPYSSSDYVFSLARYENVHIKVLTTSVRAARKGKGSPETFFPRLVKEFGAHRIAWGSNFPSEKGPMTQLVQESREALSCLSASDQEWIFSRTAQKLFPVLADE